MVLEQCLSLREATDRDGGKAAKDSHYAVHKDEKAEEFRKEIEEGVHQPGFEFMGEKSSLFLLPKIHFRKGLSSLLLFQ